MQQKFFWISLFASLFLFLGTDCCMAQSSLPEVPRQRGRNYYPAPVPDSVARLQDSLRQAYVQDSIKNRFATEFNQLIYENPYREGFLDQRLSGLPTQVPPKWLVWPEHLKTTMQGLVVSGVDRPQRPLWVLVTAALLFLCVGVIRFIFPAEFHIIIDAYYRERLLQQISKEDSIATSWPYVFLYGVFSLALGLFIVVYMSGFRDAAFLTFGNYLRASGLIAVLFILKILLVRIVSFVFGLERLVREYITVIYLVYFNSMLFLLPFLLFIILSPVSYFNILLILFVASISIMFIYRVLRTVLNVFNQTQFSISYLIIYLCTLEIAPILLLIRALGN